MTDEQDYLNTPLLVKLKKQNFKIGIGLSLLLIAIPLLCAISIYWVSDPISSAFIFTLALLVYLPLVIVQMLFLYKYLGNFGDSEKACYFMRFLIVSTFILFLLACLAAFIGMYSEIYTIIVALIPQFFVGWQLIKISKRNRDFVGGLFFLGIMMCVSAILVPLIVLIPILTGYVFIKANRYTERTT